MEPSPPPGAASRRRPRGRVVIAATLAGLLAILPGGLVALRVRDRDGDGDGDQGPVAAPGATATTATAPDPSAPPATGAPPTSTTGTPPQTPPRPKPKKPRTLRPGSHGRDVLALQQALLRLHHVDLAKATGTYDEQTRHAVVSFQ